MWRLLVAIVVLVALIIPCVAWGLPGRTSGSMPPGPETSMVTVMNESKQAVDFYVDGEFRAALESQSSVIVPMNEGYHMFMVDRKPVGPHVMDRFYVPMGGTTYTIR